MYTMVSSLQRRMLPRSRFADDDDDDVVMDVAAMETAVSTLLCVYKSACDEICRIFVKFIDESSLIWDIILC